MWDTKKISFSASEVYRGKRKGRKVQRLHFLVPLSIQSSLQASSFAAQGAWTQMCILSPNHSTAASIPVSLEFFPWLWFSSWPSPLEDWWVLPQEPSLHSHCIVAGSVQFLPLELFCPGLWSSQISQVWARPCPPCLDGSPPRKTQVHQEVVWWFKADTIPSQGQTQSLLKTGDFFSPWTSIETESETMWYSIYTSGLEWDSTAFLGALGFLMKSSCYLIPRGIYSQDPDQSPIYLITFCLPK